jgi:CRISPR-associated exonuclease Cas4
MTALLPDPDTYPPLSALNDLLFCARRCFLHRVEGVWHDNVHTVAGILGHRRVHASEDSDESPYRTARGLRLLSHRLRLVGVADIVEFRPASKSDGAATETPYPIEYKRGRKRKWDNDDVQLCAQALCLEEMLAVTVPAGAIFSLQSKRRREVLFTTALRRQTENAAQRLHEVLHSTTPPPAIRHPKCRQCSVNAICLPDLLNAQIRYARASRELFTVFPADFA